MKKLLSAVLIVLLTVTMALPAFATEDDGLKLELVSDKESYSSEDEIVLSLSAQNDSGLDIKDITLKHIAPEGYEAPQDSELSGYLASGNRMSLKAVYGGKGSAAGGNILMIIGIAAAVVVVAVIAVIIAKGKKGKNAAAMAVCMALLGSVAASAVPINAAGNTQTQELSCNVSVDGKDVIFKAEVTYMKPLDNSAKIILANSTGAAPVYIDPKSPAYDGLSLIAEAYADDIEALCGVRPEIAQTEPTSGTYVIAGVVDDELIASMNLNWSISPSNGDFKSEQWEGMKSRWLRTAARPKSS